MRGRLEELRAKGFDLDHAIGKHITSQCAPINETSNTLVQDQGIDAEEDAAEALQGSGVLTSYKFLLKLNGYHRASICAVRMHHWG